MFAVFYRFHLCLSSLRKIKNAERNRKLAQGWNWESGFHSFPAICLVDALLASACLTKWSQVLPTALHMYGICKNQHLFFLLLLIRLCSASLEFGAFPDLRPYQWEASVIAHSITFSWVASVIPASLGLPWGQSVMSGLSCLPGVRSLAARVEQRLLDDGFARGSTSGVRPFFLL